MLYIQQAAMEVIRKHAEEGYPLEVCGFLAGRAEGDVRWAREAWPVRNAWEDDPEQRAGMLEAMEKAGGGAGAEQWEEFSTERRFLVSPQDTASCMKRAR